MKLHLDSVSLGILKLLGQNGKLTNKELANSLHLSISPIFERRKRLEELGYIKKYVAVLDRDKLSPGFIYITKITMLDHTMESFQNFSQTILLTKEVIECYHLAGSYDFLLKIVTPDMTSYHEFLHKKLTVIEGVGKIVTNSVISQIKSEYDQGGISYLSFK